MEPCGAGRKTRGMSVRGSDSGDAGVAQGFTGCPFLIVGRVNPGISPRFSRVSSWPVHSPDLRTIGVSYQPSRVQIESEFPTSHVKRANQQTYYTNKNPIGDECGSPNDAREPASRSIAPLIARYICRLVMIGEHSPMLA